MPCGVDWRATETWLRVNLLQVSEIWFQVHRCCCQIFVLVADAGELNLLRTLFLLLLERLFEEFVILFRLQLGELHDVILLRFADSNTQQLLDIQLALLRLQGRLLQLQRTVSGADSLRVVLNGLLRFNLELCPGHFALQL